MVAERLNPPDDQVADTTIVALGDDDVPAMVVLVELTQPGPFRPRTIELGHYYGVFDGDRLIAMAGERLQTPWFTEISAVCTHPDARGRGLAAVLTYHVASAIAARGQTPILHVAAHNHAARRVYERLGFTVRRQLAFIGARTPAHRGDEPNAAAARPATEIGQ
jgi:predicted GNAT family acetyltransferase